jgi:hypothetical protein
MGMERGDLHLPGDVGKDPGNIPQPGRISMSFCLEKFNFPQ